jgi:uncharacterized protein (DUF1330 family)
MTGGDGDAITLAFMGYADGSTAEQAVAFEDSVLPLLQDHGAKVLFRGRRTEGQDESLPLEVHVLWFPSRAALEGYLGDDRRRALVEQYGNAFSVKQTVEVTAIDPR